MNPSTTQVVVAFITALSVILAPLLVVVYQDHRKRNQAKQEQAATREQAVADLLREHAGYRASVRRDIRALEEEVREAWADADMWRERAERERERADRLDDGWYGQRRR